MCELIKYVSELQRDWDHVVKNSKNGTFLLLRDYMDYHSERFVDKSFIFYDKSNPIAVFPASSHGENIISHGGLTYGGIIYGKEIHATQVDKMLSALEIEYKKLNFKKLIYKPVPRVFHKYSADEDLYFLFRKGAILVRRDLSSVINLESRPKFSDSRKNTARKSSKAGAVFSELSIVDEFHKLLASVLLKFNATPVHSRDELELLKRRFPSNIRIFGVTLEGQLLAGAIIFDCGHVVHTQYMASSENGRKLGALDFLLTNLIENVFFDKEYISFGISTEMQGTILNEGLLRQKEGFGARGMVHDFYEWDLSND